MVLFCAVAKCKNSTQTPGISFHRLPSDEAMKMTWMAKIRNDLKKNNKIIEAMRICSAHFKPDDYKIISNGKRILKKDAQPTIFPSNLCRKSKASKETMQLINVKNERIFEEDEKIEVEVDYNENCIELFEENDSNFANLPDVILLKIFNMLHFEDRCRAGSVCRRWYNISKSPAVWKKVEVKVKSPYHLLKFLLLLPSSVTYLNIFCHSFDIHHPLWLPDILSRLHERCPRIKSLIFENVFFSQRFCNAGFTTDHVLYAVETGSSNLTKLELYGRRDIPLCSKECCSNKINQDKYVPDNRPHELSLLSLRYSRSYMCHLSSRLSQFIPRIKVLDLTYSASIKDAVIPFFARLTHLEELYLVGCPITNSGIENLMKHLRKLKVLDLEGCRGVDDETFEILQMHGESLEQLYLGNTCIKALHHVIGVEEVFPHLEMLCLKNTLVDDMYILNIIQLCPTLKCIDISFCKISALFLLKENARFWTKQLISEEDEENYLAFCHHFKAKYISCD